MSAGCIITGPDPQGDPKPTEPPGPYDPVVLATQAVDVCNFVTTYEENVIDVEPPPEDPYAMTDDCRQVLWGELDNHVRFAGIDPRHPDHAALVTNILRAFHTLLFRPLFTPPVVCDGRECDERPILFAGGRHEFPIAWFVTHAVPVVPESYDYVIPEDLQNDELATAFFSVVHVIRTEVMASGTLARYDVCEATNGFCTEGEGIITLNPAAFAVSGLSALELAAALVHEAAHSAMPHHIGDTDPGDGCNAYLLASQPGYVHDCDPDTSAYWVEYSYLQAATIGGLVSRPAGGGPESYIEPDDSVAQARLVAACSEAQSRNFAFGNVADAVPDFCLNANDHALHPLFMIHPVWSGDCTNEPFTGADISDSGRCCGTADYLCELP
jgi:hypothetical protein